ncbi:MAG: hypothetical protein IKR91_06340 [Alloprevotella sp.]|nr:hypothetical protein [Alloprevotella sp.]
MDTRNNLRGSHLSLGFLLGLAILLLIFFGCKRVEYVTVPVPEIHNEYHFLRDSVHTRDTIENYQMTVVREVDSTTMAQYGIQLAAAERAWLVQTDALKKQIRELRESRSDTTMKHDSIPVIVPHDVVKEVPREKHWWETLLEWLGTLSLGACLLWLFIKVFPLLRKTLIK